MTSLNVEAEISELKRRMTELESDMRGEKTLTRRMFDQMRELRDDVAVLRSHAVATGRAVEELQSDMRELNGKFDNLNGKFDDLRKTMAADKAELPGMIAEVMREVLKSRG